MNIEEAFNEACRQLGALSVETAHLRAEVQRQADRIVELTTEPPAGSE